MGILSKRAKNRILISLRSPFGCWDACASNAQAAAAVAIGNDCAGLLAAAGGGGGGDNSSSRLPFLPLTLTALAPVSYFAWNSQNDPVRCRTSGVS